jgi:hypothetical protein
MRAPPAGAGLSCGREEPDFARRIKASWIDFLSGWLSKVDTELVAQATLDQAARAAQANTRPVAGPSLQSTLYNGGTPSSATAAPGGGGTGAGRGGGRSAGGSSGGRKSGGSSGSGTSVTPTGGSAATTTTPPWRVVRFKRSTPCSPDVVGDTAGVLGAPSCTKCNIGPHCHGEGQLTWGASGTPLPGFGADGSRIPGDWSKTDNVPIRRVVKACVTFLQDFANFHNRAPEEVAGVVGAQDVSDFQMRESTAPRKPRRPWVGKPPPPPSAREGSGPRVAAIAPPSVAPEHPFLSAIRSNALLNQIQHADSSSQGRRTARLVGDLAAITSMLTMSFADLLFRFMSDTPADHSQRYSAGHRHHS